MKVARVGIEQRKLRLRRLDHAGGAVPRERHVVVDIQIRSAGVVIEILDPPANDFQRSRIRNAESICQKGAACGKRFAESRLSGWKAIGWNSQQQIRIWRKASPHWTLQSISHTGKIRAQLQQIENHLTMEMWRPAAVFLCRADAGELLAACDALSNLEVAKRLFGKMPVEREEFLANVGFMPQNHHPSVVQGSRIILHTPHHSIHPPSHRTASLNKKVHAKVHRAPFVSGIAGRAE